MVGWLRPWILQLDKLRAEHRLGYVELLQLWAKSHYLPETRSLHLGKKWVGIIVLYSFPIAAVADFHKHSGLKQHEFITMQFRCPKYVS